MKQTLRVLIKHLKHASLMLSMILALSGCDLLNLGENDPDDASSMGEWEVTEFTGLITDERTGGGIADLCDYYLTSYQPVVGDDQTFILFQDREYDPNLQNVPHEVYDTLNVINEGGVFIFHFSFDNGYHGNEVLDGSGVQYNYSTLLPGSWTFAVGVWTDDGVEGEIRIGTASGGFSSFGVRGQFVNEDRIEGQWLWEEQTAWSAIPAECNSEAFGEGNWVAIRK